MRACLHFLVKVDKSGARTLVGRGGLDCPRTRQCYLMLLGRRSHPASSRNSCACMYGKLVMQPCI